MSGLCQVHTNGLKRKHKCSDCNEEFRSMVTDHIARGHNGERPLNSPTCKVLCLWSKKFGEK